MQEQQETSYEAQVNYYTEKINSNPEWVFAGIYADDGKSATMTRKRNDFQAMIDDCMAGKIDMVITKSISRFARNTVDSLTHIRKLKAKNIAVYFEKENINTLGDGGEMLITILSSQAQEESRNLSENVHWGYVRQFENGVVYVNHNKFLGYTKDEEGNLIIVPDEAKLVRRIFRLYLEGNSINKIAETLTKEGIRTVTGNTVWHATVISKMLMNEKYMGDALLQKPIPWISWKRRGRSIKESYRSITSRATMKRLSLGNCFTRYRRNGPAGRMFTARQKRREPPSGENTVPSMCWPTSCTAKSADSLTAGRYG